MRPKYINNPNAQDEAGCSDGFAGKGSGLKGQGLKGLRLPGLAKACPVLAFRATLADLCPIFTYSCRPGLRGEQSPFRF